MSNDRNNHRSHAPRLARLALHVPDAGSSGVIDIADLRAEPLTAALASSLVVSRPRPAPVSRTWPAVALRSTLALGVTLLGLAAAFQLAPALATDDTTTTTGQLAMHEAASDSPAHALAPAPIEARSRAPARYTDEPKPSEEVESLDADPIPPEPTVEPEPPAKAVSKTTSKTRSRSTSSTSTAKPKTSPAPSSPSSSISVECVLDPTRCAAKSPGKASSSSPGSRPAALPAKLSISQLKTALATTKADARRCGPEHGADAGTTVRVQLSIDGATGSVLSATPKDDHAKTALGVCVARALGQTQFSRFSAKRMGTLYSVRL